MVVDVACPNKDSLTEGIIEIRWCSQGTLDTTGNNHSSSVMFLLAKWAVPVLLCNFYYLYYYFTSLSDLNSVYHMKYETSECYMKWYSTTLLKVSVY